MIGGSLVEVDVQWALYGMTGTADSEGYGIVACSTGDLDRANFADVLSRFQVGELNHLPQVSVSYARRDTQPGLSYLALAIHWSATEQGRRYAVGIRERDHRGLPIAYTSYFSLPYKPLAAAAIGYVAMYEALRDVTLPGTDGPVRRVTVAAPGARIFAADPLAMRVAALLLTGRPVCVLGSEKTSTLQRLEFIDAVMDLLPYGLRSRMAAATWTRPTNRNQRFRLFFSSAPRPDEPDHVVMWGGDPELVHVTDRAAGEYLDWLQDNLEPLARLAELTKETGFSGKGPLQALEAALSTRHRFQVRSRPITPARRYGTEESPLLEPVQVAVEGDAGEERLLACAEHAKLANPTRLRSDISFLRKIADSEIDADRRGKYQELIARLGLLRHSFLIEAKHEERLYDALLRLAFGDPLSYEAYCQVETCAGIAHGDAPHRGLLAAIAKATTSDAVVPSIVYWHLRETDERKRDRFIADQADPVTLIHELAGTRIHPLHAKILCEVTLECLIKARGRYDPLPVRDALRQHGFLARALELRYPDEDEYQVRVLGQFLAAAYPGGLGRPAIVPVLAGSADAPTPALLAAVLSLISRPRDIQLACEAYIRGSLTHVNIDSATASRVYSLVPDTDWASFLASTREPQEPTPAEPPGN